MTECGAGYATARLPVADAFYTGRKFTLIKFHYFRLMSFAN